MAFQPVKKKRGGEVKALGYKRGPGVVVAAIHDSR